ncbi:MAG: hypothetical protein QNJ64_04920 [Crocosphaera sp.]|nr:hypothetical protein [Crocosphaera sp.]
MQENAEILLNEFRSRVEKKELTRTKIENLFVDNSLDESDVLTVYDGLFLGLFTDFEQLLEELFWGLLGGKITIDGHKINEIRKVKISPRSEINSVILGGQRYLDWLPYEKTIERAKIFFHDGVPFTNIDSDQKNNLRYYHRIRNAIAHKSPKSQAYFNKIIQNLPLLSSPRTPAGYLRSKPRRQETQYEIASAQLIQIALNLCRINV